MPATLKGKTQPKKEEKLQEPVDYKVIFLNDDYTTREFVVDVLMTVFHLPQSRATSVMLRVHRQGWGEAGRYSWDIANTKVNQVHALARENDYPLRCIVEEV